MKITEAQNTAVTHVSAATAPEAISETVDFTPHAAPTDRVTTDETVNFRASVAHGVSMAASERAVRIQSLAQAVRSGAYHPMASNLADQILAQAELEARLAAYLG